MFWAHSSLLFQIRLTRSTNSKELKDKENGWTLGELRVKNGEKFQVFLLFYLCYFFIFNHVQLKKNLYIFFRKIIIIFINLQGKRRQTPLVPEANLLNADGSMNPRLLKIVTEWFETFSTNGKMACDQCANFMNSCLKCTYFFF